MKGTIYKLYNTVNKKYYIGSTTKRMCTRMAIYRYHVRHNYGGSRLHKEMRKTGVENWKYKILESGEYDGQTELRKKKEKYLKKYKTKNSLNTNKGIRTNEDKNEYAREYYKKKGHIRLKQRYEENKEELLIKQKEYYEKNKEKYKAYYEKVKDNPEYKERHKEYREKYKEKKNQKPILENKEEVGFNPFEN